MKAILTTIKLDKLKLDTNNPRFAELYSGSNSEDELIQYLLFNEAAEEVAKGIDIAGEFYPDRPLWVIKENDYYLVKDGNRRCAAVKALNNPDKYDLKLSTKNINELPVLIYNRREDLDNRILQEHTNNLFREWDRIAKALEVYKIYTNGSSIDSMKEIDSQPAQLIKLASFYYEAVKIGGDDLKRLLRRGRKNGGKTIIFERLFSHSDLCGYSFFNKPSYKINIKDKILFENYVNALVQYLIEHPEIKTEDIDKKKETFLDELEPYGFMIQKKQPNETIVSGKQDSSDQDTAQPKPTENDVNQSQTASPLSDVRPDSSKNRKSIKTKPKYTRKQIPATLDVLIKECYSIEAMQYPNAKTALSRVTFECTLKYIMENTKYNKKTLLCNSNYFKNAFYDKNNIKKVYTDFSKLKSLFSDLISDTGIKKAFEEFDLDKIHQIIHNYHVGAIPADAIGICNNLLPLIEFMLQEESDLINSINNSRL